MHSELRQQLRLVQPVLIDLAWKLHEVARHRGTRQIRIGHVRQHAVQPMPELMKQRARVVVGKQHRLPRRRLVQIEIVQHQRNDLAVHLLLVTEARHPRAGRFAWPREIIAVEDRDRLLAALHLPHAHFRRIARNVVPLVERDTEQPRRRRELRLDQLVQLQIGLQRRRIEIVARLAQLLGVVAPVPRRQLEIGALVVDQRLQIVALLQRPLARRRPDAIQQR